MMDWIVLFVGLLTGAYFYIRGLFLDDCEERYLEARTRYYRTHMDEGTGQLMDFLCDGEHWKSWTERWLIFWNWNDTAIVKPGMYCLLGRYYDPRG